MTNKSEHDGDNSKTIEISDMKYHIFQVCGVAPARLGRAAGLCLSGLPGSCASILPSRPSQCPCFLRDQRSGWRVRVSQAE